MTASPDGGDAPAPSRECARLVRRLHAALGAAGSTVAVAESLTGGLLAFELADAPGASAVFLGSVTAYSSEIKSAVLGVDRALLDARGAVDPQVAREMATGVRRLMGSTYALSTTGVAGPQPQDGKPIGTVYIALAAPGGTRVVGASCDGDRHSVQRECVERALHLLQDHLRPDP